MSLAADLDTFDMGEIFFLIAHFKKTGRLTFSLPAGGGEIYFKEGEAVSASFQGLQGTEALYRLFLESKGTVQFTPGIAAPERNVEEDSDRIVEELDRRRVELREVTRTLPPFETVLVRASEPPTGTVVAVRRTDWHVLGLIDGKRTIESVIANSRMGILEACKTVSWLLTHGLILDPGVTARALREEVAVVNIILDEFGVQELGTETWENVVAREFDRQLGGRQISRVISFENGRLRVAEGEGWTASEQEVRSLFGSLREALEKEAIAELGPVLARRKLDKVRARAASIAQADLAAVSGGEHEGGRA
ncbi:hypothetical protein AMJ39_00445 [candidate division TA06 bacterium DG_24]|jgi:hypothetical protein|uniref:PatA-like N-terminal domain-containing protein n=2 Tax=Bacteria division TA06 TaxID=1156500 RepID=A0A0S8JI01_UNCT6|nr:MAG: hypothetical protein AMJ39_00445 [candidate division TA06 bacterium DG_24]KPL09184.1 MAG: hypothetical protein AMJ71_07110 [candidate division TA06 bacterium SM1_40]